LYIGKEYDEKEIFLPRYFAVFFNQEKSNILAEKNVREALNLATDKKEIVARILDNKGLVADSPILPNILGFAQPSRIYELDLVKANENLDKIGFKDVDGDGIREKTVQTSDQFQFKSDLVPGSRGDEVKELQTCLAKDPDIYPEGEITGFFSEPTKKAVIRFQEKYAKEILEPIGYTKGTGEVRKSTRTKLNELCSRQARQETIPLKIVLTVPDQDFLVDTANILKEQWKKAGIETDINKVQPLQMGQDIIKPRNYEALLFGEVLGSIPDPFPFWHSTQKRDPGLNLSLYESKNADALLKNAREMQDSPERNKKYEDFQNIVIQDMAAVFLYSPDYVYYVSKNIQGFEVKTITDPSQRFSGIENWYTGTKRVWQ